MQKVKKILSTLIATSMLLSMSSQAVLANQLSSDIHESKELSISAYSDAFPDAYIEENFIDLSDVDLIFKNGTIQSNTSDEIINELIAELNKDPNSISTVRNSINEGIKILGVAEATVFVDEEYKEIDGRLQVVNSKLLSKDEVDSISISERNPVYNSSEKLTIRLYLLEQSVSRGVKYALSGNAYWSGSGLNSTSPASGDDYMGFTWGGQHDFSETGIYVFSSNENYPLGGVLADSAPNASVVYRFEEECNNFNHPYHYANQITIGSTINKNTLTGQGNTTSVTLKYIHTYTSVKGSLSFSTSSSGSSAGFSLTGVDKQWPLAVTITGLKY